MVQLEGIGHLKNSMTSSGIKPMAPHDSTNYTACIAQIFLSYSPPPPTQNSLPLDQAVVHIRVSGIN
jgi:hypothetical protein